MMGRKDNTAMTHIALTVSEFIADHAAAILGFCAGALAILTLWWHEHPEEFFHRHRAPDPAADNPLMHDHDADDHAA